MGSAYLASANNAGTREQRAGAVPVPGMYHVRGGTRQRLLFALWEAELGRWGTISDPLSPAIVECGWGEPGDVPIAGLGSNFVSPLSGDTDSRRSLFRSGGTAANGILYMMTGPTCDYGATQSISQGTTPPRWRVFSVGDMTGDGKAEVVQYDQETGSVRWYTSESSYATLGGSRTLGLSLAEFL